MRKRGLINTILIILLFIPGMAQGGKIYLNFQLENVEKTPENLNFRYSGLDNININHDFSLPVQTVTVITDAFIDVTDLSIYTENEIIIGLSENKNTTWEYLTTGETNRPMPDSDNAARQLLSPLYNISNFTRDGQSYMTLSILPIVIDRNQNIIFNSRIMIENPHIIENSFERQSPYSCPADFDKPARATAARINAPDNLAFGKDYVIITAAALAPSFSQLARYKTGAGINTGVILADSIYNYYPGIDKAEQIREYLKDFYLAGGKYVLLGGDNIIIPSRYVYYYNTDYPPVDAYYLMPSDLYYADLSGTWDVDGDGIWGEPSDDAPDMRPELIIGRLPVQTPEEAHNYIDKLIRYETNPGNGDFDYLNKALFFSSDEMRDYPAEGQHHLIAGELPGNIEAEIDFGVEFPSGYDANPTNATGAESIAKISEGFGLIHILAHGRIDGFMVRSANYGDWPASLIITGPQNSGHGSTAHIAPNYKSALYYSLSCNVGGYDLDSINGAPGNYSFVEKIISLDSGGAIGMIANSRWGWVYSSYYLEKAFTRHLYGSAEGNPAVAMYNSWVDYPYYRDLIYGQNYFGDPSLKIYIDRPQKLEASISKPDDFFELLLSGTSQPVTGVAVSVMLGDDIIETGFSDNEGKYIFQNELTGSNEYNIIAVAAGYTIAQLSLVPSLALSTDDNEDDNELIPRQFSLGQNYPNPFNRATNINYGLSSNTDVVLRIYNLKGEIVKSFEFINQSAGEYTITWDGEDGNGYEIASGIYFYRLDAGEYIETRKMCLIK